MSTAASLTEGSAPSCSRLETVKDSGIGVKEGVVEAMKAMTSTKLDSIPWE